MVMKPLRTITADDEPLASELLLSILADVPEVEVISVCKNGEEALDAIIEHEPDLVMLDIKMPGMSGIDVLRAVQSDVMPLAIFVTAYEQYAIKAFDAHAIDYVLKPIDKDRIREAISRAVTWYQGRYATQDMKRRILEAVESVMGELEPASASNSRVPSSSDAASDDESGYITIRESGITLSISHEDIDWIDAAGDLMCIHAKGKTYIKRDTLAGLLRCLSPSDFKRVHRSTVVNINRIKSVTPHRKGEFYLLLDCAERIKVSRTYNDVVKTYLEP